MGHRRLVEFSPRAVQEVERARDWWLENRDKVPNAFDEALADLVERLEAGAEHVGARARIMPGLRRVLLSRIRYYAYFRIVAGDRVQVAALWHASRGREPQLG